MEPQRSGASPDTYLVESSCHTSQCWKLNAEFRDQTQVRIVSYQTVSAALIILYRADGPGGLKKKNPKQNKKNNLYINSKTFPVRTAPPLVIYTVYSSCRRPQQLCSLFFQAVWKSRGWGRRIGSGWNNVQVDRLVTCRWEVRQLPSHSQVHGAGTGERCWWVQHTHSLTSTRPAKSENATFSPLSKINWYFPASNRG